MNFIFIPMGGDFGPMPPWFAVVLVISLVLFVVALVLMGIDIVMDRFDTRFMKWAGVFLMGAAVLLISGIGYGILTEVVLK